MSIILKLRTEGARYKAKIRDSRIKQMPRFVEGSDLLAGKKVHFNDSPSYLQQRNEIFYRGIYKFNTTSPHPRILDCGGNIGLSAIYFRQQYPTARITVFEPDPSIASLCEQNLASFGYTDVEVQRKAIWTTDEILHFDARGAASGRIGDIGDSDKKIPVEAINFAAYLEKEAHIDFLKMDIEGAENSIFRSIEPYYSKIDNFFIEYHSTQNAPQQLSYILEGLTKSGFRYYLESEIQMADQPFATPPAFDSFDTMIMIFAYRIR